MDIEEEECSSQRENSHHIVQDTSSVMHSQSIQVPLEEASLDNRILCIIDRNVLPWLAILYSFALIDRSNVSPFPKKESVPVKDTMG